VQRRHHRTGAHGAHLRGERAASLAQFLLPMLFWFWPAYDPNRRSNETSCDVGMPVRIGGPALRAKLSGAAHSFHRAVCGRRRRRHFRAHDRQKYYEAMGHTVVVDNRPGANGIIGSDLVAKSPADGYTIVMGNSAPFVL